MRKHKTLGLDEDTNTFILEFEEGVGSGIPFSFKTVEFIEDEDKLRLKFDYNLHDLLPENFDKSTFEQCLGDFLLECIMSGINNKSLGYIKDEHRENDSIESTPQRGIYP